MCSWCLSRYELAEYGRKTSTRRYRMRSANYLAVMLLLLVTTVNGATLLFNNNPLSGVPNVGGQIVNGAGGGPVFSFDPLTDVIAFDAGAFGVNSVNFASGNTTDPGFPTT